MNLIRKFRGKVSEAMKIILHGATNGSNFGDFLFADIFYNKVLECNENGENVFFEFPKYGIGDFFRNELGYTHKQTVGDILTADMLVYISGVPVAAQAPTGIGSAVTVVKRVLFTSLSLVAMYSNLFMLPSPLNLMIPVMNTPAKFPFKTALLSSLGLEVRMNSY